MIQIILCAPDLGPGTNPLYDLIQKVCGQIPNVQVKRSSALDEKCFGVVNFGNSFGFMDTDFTKRFPSLQSQIQDLIQKQYLGELLVGQADAVPTGDLAVPNVILAPIMRVPMTLPSNTVNVYLALKAAILTVWKMWKTSDDVTIAVPGVTAVTPDLCAKQFRKAIEDRLFVLPEFPKTVEDASAKHQRLYTDGLSTLL